MRTYLCVMSVFGARSAVFARTGRVLSITSQATRNFIVLEGFDRHRNVLLQLDVHWNVADWYECSTESRPCKQVRARTPVSRACVAHGLRCLRVRGACCPSLLKQLVILSFFEVSTGTVICCYNSMCTGMYRVGVNVPLKASRANKHAHVPPCHERVWRTVCGVCAYGARVAHHFLSNS